MGSSSILGTLPSHLLTFIFSFLDSHTLCSVRLACRGFCQAASESIRTLRMALEQAEEAPRSGLTRFPKVDCVDYTMDLRKCQVGVPTWLEPAVTSLTLKSEKDDMHNEPDLLSTYLDLAVLAAYRLPHISSLKIEACLAVVLRPWPHRWDTSLAKLTQLESLDFNMCSFDVFDQVTHLTRLTRLKLGRMGLARRFPPLDKLTGLRALREFGLSMDGFDIVPLPPLTALQALTWVATGMTSPDNRHPPYDRFLQALPNLHTLELGVTCEEHMADVVALTGLRSLTLNLSHGGKGLSHSLTALRRLSGLTSLALDLPLLLDSDPGAQRVELDVVESSLRGVSLPGLWELTLSGLDDGLLRVAKPLFSASLTKLTLHGTLAMPMPIDEDALKPLSNLRSLTVAEWDVGCLVNLFQGPLSMLTCLELPGSLDLVDPHALAFQNLQHLSVLRLDRCPYISGDFLRQLSGLTRLSLLSIEGCMGVSPHHLKMFRGLVEPKRAAYGLPPVKVEGGGNGGPPKDGFFPAMPLLPVPMFPFWDEEEEYDDDDGYDDPFPFEDEYGFGVPMGYMGGF
eukprot:jgi/Botrbrau1/13507/Bobra.0082s0100.1